MNEFGWYKPCGTFEAMSNVVEESIKLIRSEKMQEHKKYMSHYEWMNDFATVKIHMPRRSGHTTFASALLCGCDNSVLLTKAFNEKRNCEEIIWGFKYIPFNQRANIVTRIITPSEIHRLRTFSRLTNITFLIIDRASDIRQDDIQKVMQCFKNVEMKIELQ